MDNWQHEARIIKADMKKRYTLGVVYEPNVVDSQGDWTDVEEIEKAAHGFMLALQGKVSKSVAALVDVIVEGLTNDHMAFVDVTDIWQDLQKASAGLGYMHQVWDEGIGDIVECYVAPADMVINGQVVKQGTWLLGVVWSPEYWQKVEAGEITGFSMGGTGRRVDDDAQAG